jgi:hypothetical protein
MRSNQLEPRLEHDFRVNANTDALEEVRGRVLVKVMHP